jgi:hypothetical protein
MTPALTFEELLIWNDEVSQWWKAHLDASPELLELPCGIGGAANVQALVRHIWVAELRWAHRLAGLPEIVVDDLPTGPLDKLYGLRDPGQARRRSQPGLGRDSSADQQLLAAGETHAHAAQDHGAGSDPRAETLGAISHAGPRRRLSFRLRRRPAPVERSALNGPKKPVLLNAPC